MFSATKLISLLILAVAANAQSSAKTSASSTAAPTTAAGISPCILACVEPAATANGCAFTDAACVCASAQFQADAAACLQLHCSTADLNAALALQKSECAPLSITPSGSATPHSVSFTTPASASATGSAASASGSTTKPAGSTVKASSATASAAASTTAKSSASSNQVAFGLGGVLAFAGVALAL